MAYTLIFNSEKLQLNQPNLGSRLTVVQHYKELNKTDATQGVVNRVQWALTTTVLGYIYVCIVCDVKAEAYDTCKQKQQRHCFHAT